MTYNLYLEAAKLHSPELFEAYEEASERWDDAYNKWAEADKPNEAQREQPFEAYKRWMKTRKKIITAYPGLEYEDLLYGKGD